VNLSRWPSTLGPYACEYKARYQSAFRKIVADLLALATDPAKFDYQSGGRDEWLAKIHGIRLSEITPAKIREWKQSFLAAVRDDPLALRQARISETHFSGDRAASFRERSFGNCHSAAPSLSCPLPCLSMA